jgi:hypothetical protein
MNLSFVVSDRDLKKEYNMEKLTIVTLIVGATPIEEIVDVGAGFKGSGHDGQFDSTHKAFVLRQASWSTEVTDAETVRPASPNPL